VDAYVTARPGGGESGGADRRAGSGKADAARLSDSPSTHLQENIAVTTAHTPAAGDTAEAASAAATRERGATVWLTGLPSSGKTTLAFALAERLRAEGHKVEVLDGDEIREFPSKGLGFTKEDRHTNVTRIGFVARKPASHGVKVMAPVIAPYADSRAAVGERHAAGGTEFLEIHVATPVELCSEHDVKGLYARQAAGEIPGLTGVDDPYEAPDNPELRIRTQGRSVAESAAELHTFLTERGLV
jgi:adenylylsulfate kinase